MIDFSWIVLYNNSIKREEIRAMSKTRGWYLFEDGYEAWYNGMSASEKKREIFKHGKIVRFTPTN